MSLTGKTTGLQPVFDATDIVNVNMTSGDGLLLYDSNALCIPHCKDYHHHTTVMTHKSSREKCPMEKGAAQQSSKLKGKGVAQSQEPKTKGVKVTTTQLTHKRNKRKLSTSREESDESRRGSEENLTLKKVEKHSWICKGSEDDEAILDGTDDEVEVLSQPSGSESDGDLESSDDEVRVAVNEISSVLFKKRDRKLNWRIVIILQLLPSIKQRRERQMMYSLFLLIGASSSSPMMRIALKLLKATGVRSACQ